MRITKKRKMIEVKQKKNICKLFNKNQQEKETARERETQRKLSDVLFLCFFGRKKVKNCLYNFILCFLRFCFFFRSFSFTIQLMY